mgnify:CR=1 FL=1|tara:strand:+ start:229 stop:1896 length:1668 start_codon:yes stop_codon:yes gene_type:complete
MPYIGSGVQRFNTADNLTVSGTSELKNNVTVTGDVTASGTVLPTGDTAAGDAAALGFTSAEGLILTGQGSTSDVVIKNDADTTVCFVPTGTDDLKFNDTARIIMGTGDDLQIIHDGSNSIISDNGTGNLVLRSDAQAVEIDFNTDETAALFKHNGAVELYHDNSKKFETTSSGIDVTGALATSGDVNVAGTLNVAGSIVHTGDTDTKAVFSTDNYTLTVGNTNVLEVGSAIVFNEDSADIDFRVESNGNANMLFVDAGNDVVVLGANSATASGSPALESRGSVSIIKNHTDASSSGNVSFGAGNQALTLSNTQGGANNLTSKLGFTISTTGANTDGLIEYASTAAGTGHFRFYTEISNTISEKARLVGTEFLVGLQTANGLGGSQDDNGVEIGPGYININRDDTTEVNTMTFSKNGSSVGSIVTGASSTTFNTSSDYRLKENVTDLTGATERLKQLKPKRFNFIAEADKTVDGFLAHEAQAVVPEAVTGTKDGTRVIETVVTPDEYDNDGNLTKKAVIETETVAHYQGIDQSKLVPLLVATIQELEARIVALENA